MVTQNDNSATGVEDSPRLLDLFCGAGGCSVGYSRAGFAPYGIDNDPKPLKSYPFPYICMDALEAMDRLLSGEGLTFSNGETLYLAEFAAFHASPPCQGWTGLQDVTKKHTGKDVAARYPDLLTPMRPRLIATGRPYVIENVTKCKAIKTMIILCGASLGLKNLQRHRHFESNVMMFQPKCSHTKEAQIYGVYGKLDGRIIFGRKEYRATYAAKGLEHACKLLGVDWEVTESEIVEMIPPIYLEYVGKYLLQAVRGSPDAPPLSKAIKP